MAVIGEVEGSKVFSPSAEALIAAASAQLSIPPTEESAKKQKISSREDEPQDAVVVTLSPEASASVANNKQSSSIEKTFSSSTYNNQALPSKKTAADEDSEKTKKAREQQEIEHLKKRDREVRAHEQAHLAALGPYAKGGAQFSYQVGPDGKSYAVNGEVSIDVSAEKTAEQTIQKAKIIKRAALAPAQPSGADRTVAAAAAQMETQARAELGARTGDPQPASPARQKPH